MSDVCVRRCSSRRSRTALRNFAVNLTGNSEENKPEK
jgi:hypothetical protein